MHTSSLVARFDGFRLFIALCPDHMGLGIMAWVKFFLCPGAAYYETRPQVRCSFFFITPVITSLAISTYPTVRLLVPTSITLLHFLAISAHQHCLFLHPMYSNTRDLLIKHNHLHNHMFLDIPRLKRPTTSIIFYLNGNGCRSSFSFESRDHFHSKV